MLVLPPSSSMGLKGNDEFPLYEMLVLPPSSSMGLKGNDEFPLLYS
jgi:hypothetical protein